MCEEKPLVLVGAFSQKKLFPSISSRRSYYRVLSLIPLAMRKPTTVRFYLTSKEKSETSIERTHYY